MKKSILKVVHESAKGLHKAGLISKQTMREFNAKCLSPVRDLSPKEIKRLRACLKSFMTSRDAEKMA